MKTNTKPVVSHLFRLENDKVKPIKKGDLVEIHGREWYDKVNGNSYHCVYISVNYKLEITVPFTYGYGDSYIHSATEALTEAGYIPKQDYLIDRYLREKGVHCVCHIQRNCFKRQLAKF